MGFMCPVKIEQVRDGFQVELLDDSGIVVTAPTLDVALKRAQELSREDKIAQPEAALRVRGKKSPHPHTKGVPILLFVLGVTAMLYSFIRFVLLPY
jgi:hypothetical protein